MSTTDKPKPREPERMSEDLFRGYEEEARMGYFHHDYMVERERRKREKLERRR